MNKPSFPHRRHNPLENKWILVSPQRMNRPWSGQTEKINEASLPSFDPACYLCPGNLRADGQKNPDYKSVFTFVNDYSALLPDIPAGGGEKTFFSKHNEPGICEVICYSPRHNRPMAKMSLAEIRNVILLWRGRYRTLAKNKFINHVQIFENRGNEVGNSNHHPHGQIWAQKHLPILPGKEIKIQESHYRQTQSILLLSYLNQELKAKERLIYKNNNFAIVVPFWAEWPYETMVLPRTELPALDEMSNSQISDLAKALAVISRVYANFFHRPKSGAPYTMGIHQRPTDGKLHKGIQMHFHFQPPLLTAARQKFMVGYERFAEPQRDITAERAAGELKPIAAAVKFL